MKPYDRICADVHGSINNTAIKGIIHDLYHWDDNSKPQSVQGSFAIEEAEWINSKCMVQIIEKDDDNNFSPAMVTDLTVESSDGRLSVSLIAITGSDNYTRETGHVVEFIITSKDLIPESQLQSLGTDTTLGAIVPLPDELADYADIPIVIANHNRENGSTIDGYILQKDL